jgi:hypothetical protein
MITTTPAMNSQPNSDGVRAVLCCSCSNRHSVLNVEHVFTGMDQAGIRHQD